MEKLYVMLKMLQQDKRVNILDLGIMYIGLNDTVKSNTPDADNIPEFVVRFTPGKTCRFEGDKLKVGGDNFL